MAKTKHERLSRAISSYLQKQNRDYQKAISLMEVAFSQKFPGIADDNPFKHEIFSDLEKDITQQYHDAILLCVQLKDTEKWNEQFEKEDLASTQMSQIRNITNLYKNEDKIEINLNKLAYPYFELLIKKFGGHSCIAKDINDERVIPLDHTTLAEAFELAHKHPIGNANRFAEQWEQKLISLIFEGVDWSASRKKIFIDSLLRIKSTKKYVGRWQTGYSISRKEAVTFLLYFSHRFIQNPKKNKRDGETTCLLWLLIQIAIFIDSPPPLYQLIDLTTDHLNQDVLTFVNIKNMKLSHDFARIMGSYIGARPEQRAQKLFPNLSMDNFEDLFRRASKNLLPPGSPPILPEAFLSVPHSFPGKRIPKKMMEKMREWLPVL